MQIQIESYPLKNKMKNAAKMKKKKKRKQTSALFEWHIHTYSWKQEKPQLQYTYDIHNMYVEIQGKELHSILLCRICGF